jgi:4-amino-4-deoxy-L-arabinose transferase-like glycosyltransferase
VSVAATARAVSRASLGSLGVWVAVLAIVGLAAGIRAWDLGSSGPGLRGLDEEFTLSIASQSPLDVIADSAAEDTHPPLYYLVLHGWMELAGDSRVAIRTPSLLFGVAAVGVLFLLGRALAGTRAGLVAAFLLALSPLHATYSQEARNYALLSLAAGLSCLAFVHALRSATRAASAGYVAATALLLYTHVYGLFVVAAQLVVLAVCLHRERWRGRRRWAVLTGSVGLLFLPWLVVLALQTGEELEGGADANLAWLEEPRLRWLGGTLVRYAGSWAAAGLLAAVFALAAADLARRRLPPRLRPLGLAVLLPGVWLLFSTAVPWVVSKLFVAAYQVKYTIAGLLAFCLLAALAADAPRSRTLRAAALACVVAAAVAGVVEWFADPDHDYWRGLLPAGGARGTQD